MRRTKRSVRTVPRRRLCPQLSVQRAKKGVLPGNTGKLTRMLSAKEIYRELRLREQFGEGGGEWFNAGDKTSDNLQQALSRQSKTLYKRYRLDCDRGDAIGGCSGC